MVGVGAGVRLPRPLASHVAPRPDTAGPGAVICSRPRAINRATMARFMARLQPDPYGSRQSRQPGAIAGAVSELAAKACTKYSGRHPCARRAQHRQALTVGEALFAVRSPTPQRIPHASWTRAATLKADFHDRTAYPLRGLHTAVKCEQCHAPKLPVAKRYRPLARECERPLTPAQGVSGGARRGIGQHRKHVRLGVPEGVAVVTWASQALCRDRPLLGPRAGLEGVELGEANCLLELRVAVDLDVGALPEVLEVSALLFDESVPAGVMRLGDRCPVSAGPRSP